MIHFDHILYFLKYNCLKSLSSGWNYTLCWCLFSTQTSNKTFSDFSILCSSRQSDGFTAHVLFHFTVVSHLNSLPAGTVLYAALRLTLRWPIKPYCCIVSDIICRPNVNSVAHMRACMNTCETCTMFINVFSCCKLLWKQTLGTDKYRHSEMSQSFWNGKTGE